MRLSTSKYFGQVPDGSVVKRLQEEDEDDEGQEEASPSISSSIRSNKRPTDYLTEVYILLWYINFV